MLILLPPSESKTARARGRAVDLDRISRPELTPHRAAVLAAVAQVSAGPDAARVLGVSPNLTEEIARNTRLTSAPAVPVSELYTGVLYDALGYDSLDAAARRRAGRRLVVVSALFGALRFGDRVPSYRLSMGVDLPGVGKLASHWRGPLDEVLPAVASRGVVVDLRSSTYVAAWRPTGELAERTVAVHVVRDGGDGRSAVSHMAKHTRGLVARQLLSGADPRTPEALADALSEHFAVELDDARPGRPRRLDVVEPT